MVARQAEVDVGNQALLVPELWSTSPPAVTVLRVPIVLPGVVRSGWARACQDHAVQDTIWGQEELDMGQIGKKKGIHKVLEPIKAPQVVPVPAMPVREAEKVQVR